MKLRPLNDRIVLRRAEPDEKVGLLWIPKTGQAPPMEATVIAVGPGKKLDDGTHRAITEIQVGDRVLIGNYSGADIKINEEKFLIAREGEIMCVMEDEKKHFTTDQITDKMELKAEEILPKDKEEK